MLSRRHEHKLIAGLSTRHTWWFEATPVTALDGVGPFIFRVRWSMLFDTIWGYFSI